MKPSGPRDNWVQLHVVVVLLIQAPSYSSAWRHCLAIGSSHAMIPDSLLRRLKKNEEKTCIKKNPMVLESSCFLFPWDFHGFSRYPFSTQSAWGFLVFTRRIAPVHSWLGMMPSSPISTSSGSQLKGERINRPRSVQRGPKKNLNLTGLLGNSKKHLRKKWINKHMLENPPSFGSKHTCSYSNFFQLIGRLTALNLEPWPTTFAWFFLETFNWEPNFMENVYPTFPWNRLLGIVHLEL